MADDFHPDVPTDLRVGTVSSPEPPPPDLETTAFDAADPIGLDPSDRAAVEASGPSDEQQLVPGATIAGGRYRLLVFHGGGRTCSSGRRWTPH